MTPTERAAALAAFLDATTPAWASGPAADPLMPPDELLAVLLEPHARRVGLDVVTYARAHGWITGERAGPFAAAWRAECAKRGRA